MKRLTTLLAFLLAGYLAHSQVRLNWLAATDYGMPCNSFAEGRSILRGTFPSHQWNLNTGLELRLFDRIGIEGGVGQSIRTLRAVDKTLSDEFPGYKSVIHSKNHFLMAFGGLRWLFPLNDGDFLVLSGGYCWNYSGSKSLDDYDHFTKGNQDLSVSSQYLSSNHSFYGEVGYQSGLSARSSLYIGLKVNVGKGPFMTGNYSVYNETNGDTYSDAIRDNGSYIGLNLKYYLTVAHKEKAERKPKEPRVKKPERDSQPTDEVRHILKDTMVVEGRQVIVGKSVPALESEVDISVWDAEAIDGDSISLILNGEYILRNVSLGSNKVVVHAKLQPGKNYLVMYAHNQGKYPPNTAAIIVDDGTRQNQIELKSNLNTSGALEITLGKQP